MPTLYEIAQGYSQIEEILLNAETDDDILLAEKMLTELDDQRDAKLESIGRMRVNAASDIEAVDQEIKRLQDIKRAHQNVVSSLDGIVFRMLKHSGVKSVQTELFRFSVCKAGGKVPLEIDIEALHYPQDNLPEEFVEYEEVYSPNKFLIRQALETGKAVPCCRLGERKEYLRVK